MDNLYRVREVSPELATLLQRLKTIYAITGGEVANEKGGKKDDFNAKKSMLIAQIHNFEELIKTRDSSGLASDSRDFIRLKNTINMELKRLEDGVQDLAVVHKKEIEKNRNKMSSDEMQARKEVLESVISEFQSAFKAAKGHSHAGAEENLGGGAGMRVLTSEQLMKGQFAGAGIKIKRQEMSGQDQMMMQEIQTQTQEQDQILDEISKGLDELKDVAEKMNDELALQDKMLNDLDGKTDKTQTKLDSANDRMKDMMSKLNDKSSNACVYIICLVILLGIASVVYNMAMKNK